MKEESVLTILMYLFKYHMQESPLLGTNEEQIISSLEEVGFRRPTITKAFDWLVNLADLEALKAKDNNNKHQSFRVFSDFEKAIFDAECISFIMQLEEQGILTPFLREIVINQVIQLEQEGIDVSLIKWVTLLVLFNQPKDDQALKCMELLVLDEFTGGIH